MDFKNAPKRKRVTFSGTPDVAPTQDDEDIARMQKVRRRKTTVDVDSDDDEDLDVESSDEEEEDEPTAQQRKRKNKDMEKHFADRLRQQGIDVDQDATTQQDLKPEVEKAFSRDNMKGMEKFRMGGFWNKDGQFVDDDEEKGSEVRDPWLDSLGDQEFKPPQPTASALLNASKATDDDDDDMFASGPDLPAARRKLLQLMKPGETVLKALRRLGNERDLVGSSTSSSSSAHGKGGKPKQPAQKMSFYARKRAAARAKKEAEAAAKAAAAGGSSSTAASSKKKLTDAEKKQKAKLAKDFTDLTEAADLLLQNGKFDIYQSTYMRLEHEEKLAARAEEAKRKQAAALQTQGPMWEYKFPPAAKVYGPNNARQMKAWKDNGYFKKAVCRFVPAAQGDSSATPVVANTNPNPWIKVTDDFDFFSAPSK